jgi:hypothetical protein
LRSAFLEHKDAVVSCEIPHGFYQPVPCPLENARYGVLLVITDFNADGSAGCKAAVRAFRYQAIGIEPVFAAIQRSARIEITHVRLQIVDVL